MRGGSCGVPLIAREACLVRALNNEGRWSAARRNMVVVALRCAACEAASRRAHRLAALHRRRSIRPLGGCDLPAREHLKRGLRCGVSGRGSAQIGSGDGVRSRCCADGETNPRAASISRPGNAFAPPFPLRLMPQAAAPRSGSGRVHLGRPGACVRHTRAVAALHSTSRTPPEAPLMNEAIGI